MSLSGTLDAKLQLLSDSSSKEDIHCALSILDNHTEPFSASFFDYVIHPILRHHFNPSRCPVDGDDLDQWSDKLHIFGYCCNWLSRDADRTSSTIVLDVWPGFNKYAHFLLDIYIQREDVPIDLSPLIQGMSAIYRRAPELISTRPLLGDLVVRGHFVFIQRIVRAGTGDDFKALIFIKLWSQIFHETFDAARSNPALREVLTSNTSSIAKAGVSALSRAAIVAQPNLIILRDELHNIHDLASLPQFRYDLFQCRIIYWCMHIIWRVIKILQRSTTSSIPLNDLATIIHLSLSYIHAALGYFSLDVLREALRSRLFEAILILDPLLFSQDEQTPSDQRDPEDRVTLTTSIRHLFHTIQPYAIYKDILRPLKRFLDESRFRSLWLADIENCGCGNGNLHRTLSLMEAVDELYEASLQHGNAGKHICCSPKCPDFNYGLIVKEVGRCRECSRCRQVTYCSRVCQRTDWKRHRESCSGMCTKALEYTEAMKTGDPYTTNNLRVKEIGFFYFLATRILEHNADVIRAHFVAVDETSYLNEGVTITINVNERPTASEAISFAPTTSSHQAVEKDERFVRITAQFRFMSSQILWSCYYGIVVLPELGESVPATVSPRIKIGKSALYEFPLGGWWLD